MEWCCVWGGNMCIFGFWFVVILVVVVGVFIVGYNWIYFDVIIVNEFMVMELCDDIVILVFWFIRFLFEFGFDEGKLNEFIISIFFGEIFGIYSVLVV